MEWSDLLQPEVQRFISEHADADLKTLALKKSPDTSWPYRLILDQIKVRQKARVKTPELYDADSFIFPENHVYEQASSEACARYKASLLRGSEFVDLTAGCGVDAFYISQQFDKAIWVERDDDCAKLLEHNAYTMTKKGSLSSSITVHRGLAQDFIDEYAGEKGCVLIDPQRRESGRKGLYSFATCSPNILDMLPMLRTKFSKCLVKASPVLDLEKGVSDLDCVTQAHVVQWSGECKEVLFCIDFESHDAVDDFEIIAVQLDDLGRVVKKFSYFWAEEKDVFINYALPKSYIYEPDPAFLKSGGFKSLALTYGVSKLHMHTHLYTSNEIVEDFPGKYYKVLEIKPIKSKGLGIKRADLSVRNFPMSVESLRKKLKISDGGTHRIYAVTLCNNEKRLIVCEKP